MKPYPHQEKSINEILDHLQTEKRVLYQLSTGGGKTFCFSLIAKKYIAQTNKKVLVLAHREELINQTLNTLRRINVTCESVIASKKKLNHLSSAYVGMVQTLKKRLSKDSDFLQDVGLIICDESHLLQHNWVFNYYPNAKVLGVTATPIVMKKVTFFKCCRCKEIYNSLTQCCNLETYEYTRDFTLSEIYENIIIGRSISELIEDGKLVKDLVYKTGSLDRSKLKIDAKTGDFDNTDEEFGSDNALIDVVKNYENIALGKKTIVFNSSTKINALVYDLFKSKGYDNVRLFDSENSKKSERVPLLQWFKETPDAILLNCSCFTTGFDEPTTECVIINRATTSLSLYLQMVGRGGRPCDSIYKPNFIHIDLGGNVDAFGKWSDERDWEGIFFGTNNKPKPKKEALENTTQCKSCGMIYPRNSISCPECHYEEFRREKQLTISGEVAKLIDDIPMPNGKKIVEYARRLNKDKNFCWSVLISNVCDLFIFHNVTGGSYHQSLTNGRFEESIRNIIAKPYRDIQGSDLESGTMRTKNYLIERVKKKLDKFYEKSLVA